MGNAKSTAAKSTAKTVPGPGETASQQASTEASTAATQTAIETAITRLTALALRLEAGLALSTAAPVRQRISESVAEINAIADELRAALVAAADVGTGLTGAITALALDAGSRLGCTPALNFTGDLDALAAAAPRLGQALTAVAGQMLSNVVRHSYAGTFTLSLSTGPGGVLLDVVDDGVGPAEEGVTGQGIATMTALAERHRGTFTITANEGAFGSRQRWQAPKPG